MALALILLACAPVEPPANDAPGPEPVAAAAPAGDGELAPIAHTRRTNNPKLALDGLDKRIQTLYERIGANPRERVALVDSLGLRMALRGTTSDLHRMLEVGQGQARGAALMAAHRFDEALELDPKLADSVALAREQDLDRLASERQQAVDERPSTINWMRLGDVKLAQGDARGADHAYAQALASYRDISPLTVADLQFRRGLAWGESGEDPERARALYTAAVERLPQFVRAHVHLAELEKDAGDLEAAIRRVRKVADAEDPEPGGKLAVWLEGEEAEAFRKRTITAYERLLAENPLAFADHATEFYLAIGDQQRAAELAKLNLDNRPTGRAKELCERAKCTAQGSAEPSSD